MGFLVFNGIEFTEKACGGYPFNGVDPNQLEQIFFNSLATVKSFKLERNSLVLTHKSGKLFFTKIK